MIDMREFLKKHTDSLLLFLLVALGFLLRLYQSGQLSFSNDELSALIRLRYDSLGDLIQKGIAIDGHPAGAQILLYYWTKWFGTSEWAVRLPFVLFGTFTIPLIYSFSKRIFNKEVAFYSASLIAFTAFSILYSRLARPYSMGAFAIALQWYGQSLMMDSDAKRWKWLFYILGASLAAYTHHFAALTAFLSGSFAWLLLPKSRIKEWLLASLLAVLIYLPHISVTLHQLGIGGVGEWLSKPGLDFFGDHLLHLLNDSWLLITIIVSLIIIHIWQYKWDDQKVRPRVFLALALLLPALIGFIYSRLVNPVLQDSVLIFSASAFYILLASFMETRIKGQRVVGLGFAALVLLTFAQTGFYKQKVFEDFKGAADKITNWYNSKEGADSTLYIVNINHIDYLNFYLKDETPTITFPIQIINDEEDLKELSQILQDSDKPYLFFANLRPCRAEAFDMLLDSFPFILVETYTERSSNIILCRQGPGNFKPQEAKAQSMSDADGIRTMNNYFSESVIDTLVREGNDLVIRASVQFNLIDKTNHLLVAAVEDKEGKMYEWHGIRLDYFAVRSGWHNAYLRFKPEWKNTMVIKAYLWNPDLESPNDSLVYQALCIETFHEGRQGEPMLFKTHGFR